MQRKNELVRKAADENNLLPANDLVNIFMGTLQRCLKQCQDEACSDVGELTDEQDAWKLEQLRHINDRIKLRRHGPAIQMDVTDQSELFYSVDMVPTIQIGEDDYYVAKPIKGASGPQIAWRRSFSLKEKERLLTLDEDNGCRKQVLRVLKVIRNREAGLARLTSYHLKTVLFRKTDELNDEAFWKGDRLGERLMNVLQQIEKELGSGDMPNYFLPEVNLLDGMKPVAIVNMHRRLKHLRNSERKMTKLLKL